MFFCATLFQNRHGWRRFHAVTSLLANLQPKNVQGCSFFGEDGIVQEYASLHILELQVFLTKNSRLFGTTDILSVRDVLPNGKTRVFR